MALWFGYLGSQMSWAVFVIVSIMAGTSIHHPVYSVLAVPAGRRQRFLAGAAAALVACLVAALVLGAAVAITHLLAPVAPALPFKGHSAVFKFQGLQPWGLWLPWAILPMAQVLRLIWPKKWFTALIVLYGLAPLISLTAGGPDLIHLWTPQVVAGMIIVSWCAFFLVLRWVCFRRDLVIQ